MSSRIRSPLQNCLTPIWLSPLMCHPKCISLSPKTVVPMTYFQTTAWNTPCINYISFQFKDMLALNLELSSLSNKYSENFVFNSFGVKVSINVWVITFSFQLLPNIWITYSLHGYVPQLVLENWNILQPGD